MIKANIGRVVVREWFEEVKQNGIIRPKTVETAYKMGIVQNGMMTSDELKVVDSYSETRGGNAVDLFLGKGDIVYFADRTGAKIRHDGVDYLVMDHSDILCFETRKEAEDGPR